MLDSIFCIRFAVESEAYQALTELKKVPVTPGYTLSQGAIVKREHGLVTVKDAFDTGAETHDDTALGGLIWALTGVLGDPVGMLLHGSIGALIGSAVDAKDAADNISVLEKVGQCIGEGQTAVLLMVSEEYEGALLRAFIRYNVFAEKFDAAEVQTEIEEAEKLQKEMEKETRKKLRQEKNDEKKAKIEAKRAEIRVKFEKIRNKNFQ